MTAYNIDLCSFILNEHVNSGGIVVGKVMVKGSGPSRAHNQRKHVTTDKVRWENTKARGSVTVSSRKPLIYPVYLADPFSFSLFNRDQTTVQDKVFIPFIFHFI